VDAEKGNNKKPSGDTKVDREQLKKEA